MLGAVAVTSLYDTGKGTKATWLSDVQKGF